MVALYGLKLDRDQVKGSEAATSQNISVQFVSFMYMRLFETRCHAFFDSVFDRIESPVSIHVQGDLE